LSTRPLKTEGAGNAGCPMHPQPGVRWGSQVCTPVFTAEAPETSGIPHAMVFTVSFALSPVTSSFLPPSPHGLNGAIRIPVGPIAPPRGLASATDARTTRLRRTHQCRSSCTPLLTAHEFGSPCDLRHARHRRVHRIPRSTFVTIAIRPSSMRRDGDNKSHISEKQKRFILPRGTGQANRLEAPREFRFCARANFGRLEAVSAFEWRRKDLKRQPVGQISAARLSVRPSVTEPNKGSRRDGQDPHNHLLQTLVINPSITRHQSVPSAANVLPFKSRPSHVPLRYRRARGRSHGVVRSVAHAKPSGVARRRAARCDRRP
jgi:hypothetical protein